MDVIKDLKRFFDSEYESTKRFVERHSKDTELVFSVVESAIKMCLGAAQFAQYFDNVSYEEVTKIYDEVKEKLEKLY